MFSFYLLNLTYFDFLSDLYICNSTSFYFPQVRHSSIKLLESIKDLPAELFLSLPSSLKLDVYESRYNLLGNTNKNRMKTFLPEEESLVYIAAPAASK